MAQLSQAQRRSPAVGLAGVAIAAALLGGIVGGVVGIRAQTIAQEASAAQAAGAVHAVVANQVKDDLYVSPQDQGVLKAAQEWEARERQMYPTSTSIDDLSFSARHRGVLSAAQEREARERQIYPSR